VKSKIKFYSYIHKQSHLFLDIFKQIMNRMIMVIRYRKTTHVGLTSSFTQNFVQVVYLPIGERYVQNCF